MTPRPPLPPFTIDTASQKARLAEDAWNSRDPARVALACIGAQERRFHWPPGARPGDHPGLTALGM